MKEYKGKVLFTQRFQRMFDHLGIFCYMTAARFYKGVERSEIAPKHPTPNNIEESLPLLMNNKIIIEKEGLLYLNRELFFELTVWDLLLMSDPWVKDKRRGRKTKEHLEFKQFCQESLLFKLYTEQLEKNIR